MSKCVMVPWSTPQIWQQMKLSLGMTVAAQGERLDVARAVSRQIGEKFGELDVHLDSLGGATCCHCEDICCHRATLWYDFRDLVFIYLFTSEFPEQQITRGTDLKCSYLASTGCSMVRFKRPFICSWYICPRQTHVMKKNGRINEEGQKISSLLGQIKQDRFLLENVFLKVFCTNLDFSSAEVEL